MAARLVAAGFPKDDVVVVGSSEKSAQARGNLVARYRGQGSRQPVLFIAHLDVVEARREDWSMEPFVLNEKDGYFYGRGTLDVKGVPRRWCRRSCACAPEGGCPIAI